jgi:hypothetical protein
MLADNLGYSIRENVSLFSVDDSENLATFVTESGLVIEGNYYFTDEILFDNIVVESGEIFSDKDKFDSASRNQISCFVESVYSDELVEAGSIFDDIIDSWTQKVKFNETVGKLREKSEQFNKTFNILETQEFGRFLELSENISQFIKDNKEKIQGIQEIRNAIKLSNTVSNAFNIPRVDLEKIEEGTSLSFPIKESRDIYEMICSQELLKREILESKKSFDTVWVTEPKVSDLSLKIFEEDTAEIKKALVECFVDIPYIALISKKQLSNTIKNNLDTLHENVHYTKGDLKEFTGKLFEMKKPLKALVSNLLQEKYGINLNNVKEIPTFKTLLNTQSLIFESLSKLAPRGSVIKECLFNMSEMLKGKNGVEAIDVNEGLKYLFSESGLADIYEENSVRSDFSLNESIESDEDFVSFILDTLVLEKDEKIDKEEKEDEEEEEDDDEEEENNKDEKKLKEGDSSIENTSDLMKSLSELEDLISGPDLGDE